MRTIWTIFFGTGFLLGIVVWHILGMFVTAIGRPDSSMGLKDLAGTALAAAAFLFSIVTLVVTARKAKRDAFLNIHDKLTSVDVQEGRRLLYNEINGPDDPERLLKKNPIEYDKVNRALAMYDVLGFYVYRKFVSKGWVLAEWGPHLAKARGHSKHFTSHRTEKGAPSQWENFEAISYEAWLRSPINTVPGRRAR